VGDPAVTGPLVERRRPGRILGDSRAFREPAEPEHAYASPSQARLHGRGLGEVLAHAGALLVESSRLLHPAASPPSQAPVEGSGEPEVLRDVLSLLVAEPEHPARGGVLAAAGTLVQRVRPPGVPGHSGPGLVQSREVGAASGTSPSQACW
jgi:hypothetical protein